MKAEQIIKDVNTINEKADYEGLKEIKQQEDETAKHFDLYLMELKNKPQINLSKFNLIQDYIKSVARGYSQGLILLGDAGISKTYTTRQTLIKENVNFIESRGVTSPMALYNFLYENNDKNKVLLLDDVANLINNENAFSVLLGALWDGLICWNTTSEKLKIPNKFIFNSRIIIIANKLNSYQADIIKSRCLVYDLNLSREEKLTLMYLIAQEEKEGLNKEERFKIVDFIKENTNNSSVFDLRTQQKAESLYLYSKEKWMELLKPLLIKDNSKELFIYCLKNNSTTTQAEKEFIQESGLSRRTFYRFKKEFSAIGTGMQAQEMKGGIN